MKSMARTLEKSRRARRKAGHRAPSKPGSPPLVVLTREAGRSDELSGRLRDRGIAVLEVPLTRTLAPQNRRPIDREAARAESFDWIVFTSVRGVEAFVDARRRQGLPVFERGVSGPKLAAVGSATAAAIRSEGGRVSFRPGKSNAAAMAREWPKGTLSGLRILFPRAEAGRRELSRELGQRGAVAIEVVAYRTAPIAISKKVADRLSDARFVVVVLQAPSAVKALAGEFKRRRLDLGEKLVVVAGGSTTASAVRKFLRPFALAVSARPGAASLARETLRSVRRLTVERS